MTDQPQMPLEQQVANMRGHAAQIREAVKAEFGTAREAGTPDAYRDALVNVRTYQDSLEEYVAFTIALKGGFARAAADAKAAYDTDWAQRASSPTAMRGSGGDMEGPRERYARFDVQVFPQLRAWRQTEQQSALVAELLDEMWLRFRAVNATREDLMAILRTYAFESNLER